MNIIFGQSEQFTSKSRGRIKHLVKILLWNRIKGKLTFQRSCKTSASIFPGTLVAKILASSRRVTAISGVAWQRNEKIIKHNIASSFNVSDE